MIYWYIIVSIPDLQAHSISAALHPEAIRATFRVEGFADFRSVLWGSMRFHINHRDLWGSMRFRTN